MLAIVLDDRDLHTKTSSLISVQLPSSGLTERKEPTTIVSDKTYWRYGRASAQIGPRESGEH